jgi:hypothetical protein
MKSVFWLLLFGIAAAAAWLVWHSLRKWEARKRAEEERLASFMAGTAAAAKANPAAPLPAPLSAPLPAAPADPVPAPTNDLAQQKLLFEAAHKAGEASEPALAVQLYGRLLARFPATAFASEARRAVELLKKKLVKTKL